MKRYLCFSAMLISGCAILGDQIGQPQITPMPNNKIEISMRGGVMTKRETLQAEWLKVASQRCSNYEILSRDFALQYDMPTLTGVIKCNGAPKKTPPSQNADDTEARPATTAAPRETRPEPRSNKSAASAAVAASTTKLRKTASKEAAVVKTLKKGESIAIVKQKGEWLLVETSTGEVGWCHKSGVK